MTRWLFHPLECKIVIPLSIQTIINRIKFIKTMRDNAEQVFRRGYKYQMTSLLFLDHAPRDGLLVLVMK